MLKPTYPAPASRGIVAVGEGVIFFFSVVAVAALLVVVGA